MTIPKKTGATRRPADLSSGREGAERGVQVVVSIEKKANRIYAPTPTVTFCRFPQTNEHACRGSLGICTTKRGWSGRWMRVVAACQGRGGGCVCVSQCVRYSLCARVRVCECVSRCACSCLCVTVCVLVCLCVREHDGGLTPCFEKITIDVRARTRARGCRREVII